jgi:hypothetical protein
VRSAEAAAPNAERRIVVISQPAIFSAMTEMTLKLFPYLIS